jgi:hypothetical protein
VAQCIAIDGTEERLAAGDASGRILVWHGVGAAVRAAADGGDRQQPMDLPCSTLHWHASAVRCLAFSPDSFYMLSGGQEAVLVRSRVPCAACPCSGPKLISRAWCHGVAPVEA